MAKDINLTSQEWCDIVFEGKNKTYGAYEMRQSSSKRHLIALLFIAVFAVLIGVLPTLVATVSEVVKKQNSGSITDDVKIVEVDPLEKEQEILENLTREPPPPPLKPTMQFIAPVMASAEDIEDKDRLKDQETLQKSDVQISIADIVGEDVEDAIDFADLERDRLLAEDENRIYVGVEVQPEFPGGEKELMKYIRDNLKYPTIAQENNEQGRVVIQFVVNKKGEVSNVIVLRGLSAACDKEAIRVVQSMPKWIAGKQNGVPVNVYYTLPIVYKLQN